MSLTVSESENSHSFTEFSENSTNFSTSDHHWSSYLTVLLKSNVVLCKQHFNCFTLFKLDCHLSRVHKIKASEWCCILNDSELLRIAQTESDVIHSSDETTQISHLLIHIKYICHFTECNHWSINNQTMCQHYNSAHNWIQCHKKAISWHHVTLQTLFSHNNHCWYFAVRVSHLLVNDKLNSQCYIFEFASSFIVWSDISFSFIVNWEELNSSFQSAQTSQNEQYQCVITVHHVSELISWLRHTEIFSHFQHIKITLLTNIYRLSDSAEKSTLNVICHSIEHVIQNLIKSLVHDWDSEISTLSYFNAQHLNIFKRDKTS